MSPKQCVGPKLMVSQLQPFNISCRLHTRVSKLLICLRATSLLTFKVSGAISTPYKTMQITEQLTATTAFTAFLLVSVQEAVWTSTGHHYPLH